MGRTRGHIMAVMLAACLALVYMQAAPIARGSADHSSPSVGRFVLMESTGPVFDVLYEFGQDGAARNGAYGLNVHSSSRSWYLEYQRAGGYDIIAGVVRQDPRLISLGLRILHWGLGREAADGSFPGSKSPFHGTAMFLSEAAPGLIMLRASPYVQNNASEITWQVGHMWRAARYLVRLAGRAGQLDDPSKNHRFFEAALALGAVSILTGDPVLLRSSRVYCWEGIAMERPGGVMPEDGGHDSGYQALGMVNASRYLALVATGALNHALWRVLVKGEAWELSRVSPNGSINQDGDTRTASCKEKDLAGKCKTVFYAPIYSAFAHWARISGDLRYASASFLVWKKSGYGEGSRPPAHSPGR